MTISRIYRVSVDIPEEVYQKYGHLPEYERATLRATKHSLAAGQNSYSSVEEWAEFDDLGLANECEQKLIKIAKGDLS